MGARMTPTKEELLKFVEYYENQYRHLVQKPHSFIFVRVGLGVAAWLLKADLHVYPRHCLAVCVLLYDDSKFEFLDRDEIGAMYIFTDTTLDGIMKYLDSLAAELDGVKEEFFYLYSGESDDEEDLFPMFRRGFSI